MSPKRVVIIANGDLNLNNLIFYDRLLEPDDYTICVNGGTGHALALGLKPDLIIGDLDSLEPGHKLAIEQLGSQIIRHPSEKDQSDLELAIDYAVEMQPAEILIIGALGGKRADHSFINLLLLSIPLRRGVSARIIDESQEIRLVDKEVSIEGKQGDYLSLFSLTAETGGITTKGLKFPLKREILYFASTRGLSNELTASPAKITIDSGLLLVIKTSIAGKSIDQLPFVSGKDSSSNNIS